MKQIKLAEVRERTGRKLTIEEAAQYVGPGQSNTVTRNQACALSLHSFRQIQLHLISSAG
jgi:hypothetical protein